MSRYLDEWFDLFRSRGTPQFTMGQTVSKLARWRKKGVLPARSVHHPVALTAGDRAVGLKRAGIYDLAMAELRSLLGGSVLGYVCTYSTDVVNGVTPEGADRRAARLSKIGKIGGGAPMSDDPARRAAFAYAYGMDHPEVPEDVIKNMYATMSKWQIGGATDMDQDEAGRVLLALAYHKRHPAVPEDDIKNMYDTMSKWQIGGATGRKHDAKGTYGEVAMTCGASGTTSIVRMNVDASYKILGDTVGRAKMWCAYCKAEVGMKGGKRSKITESAGLTSVLRGQAVRCATVNRIVHAVRQPGTASK